MPEVPTEKTDTVNSAHGPYTTHLFVVKDTTSVYLIGWVDYDPAFNFNRQAELEANRDNFVKGSVRLYCIVADNYRRLFGA